MVDVGSLDLPTMSESTLQSVNLNAIPALAANTLPPVEVFKNLSLLIGRQGRERVFSSYH